MATKLILSRLIVQQQKKKLHHPWFPRIVPSTTNVPSSWSSLFVSASNVSTLSSIPKIPANKNAILIHGQRRRNQSHFYDSNSKNRLLQSKQQCRSFFSLWKNNDSSSKQQQEQEFLKKGWIDSDGLTQFSTLYELTSRCNQIFKQNKNFGIFNPQIENYEYITYGMTDRMIHRCRAVLKNLGVEPYTKVGIISNNRWEWACIAAATFSLNGIIVPMYEAQLPSDWSYIVNDSHCTVLVCSTKEIYDKVQEQVQPNITNPNICTSILCLDAPPPLEELKEFIAQEKEQEKKNHQHHSLQPMLSLLQSTIDFDTIPQGEDYSFLTHMLRVAEEDVDEKLVTPPKKDDVANILYTSGTTGHPKGVELTHENMTFTIKSATRTMVRNPKEHIFETDRSLAFLPWAHSYAQTSELWLGWAHGCSAALCRGIPYIKDDLQLVQPTCLFAVPAVYKKIYDGLQLHMKYKSSPGERKIIERALKLGYKHVVHNRGLGPPLTIMEKIRYQFMNKVVLSKIREKLGGNLRNGAVGGAGMPKPLLDFMDTIGIQVLEGYGLTETSPIITANSPEQRKPGTVGRPIGGVTVYIVDEVTKQILPPGEEGEICCVGPNVMKGYHNNEEETNKVISIAPDGKSRMFHTGDLGILDEDGYLTVTGRLKEQFKLDNGKFVVPKPIEEAISMSRFILQAVVLGANRPYTVALIVPDYKFIRNELDIPQSSSSSTKKEGGASILNSREVDPLKAGDDLDDYNELANDIRVKDLIESEIRQSCYILKKYQIPQKFAIIPKCTVENRMLTAKMSIRKRKVTEVHEALIENLYNDENEDELIASSSKGRENEEKVVA